MTTVVDRFESNNLSIEVYKDGDCIITTESGFIQLTAAILARMRAGSPAPKQAVKEEVSAISVPVITPPESPPPAKTEAKRQMLGKGEKGWEVRFTSAEGGEQSHFYTSRSFARLAEPANTVGQNGRVA